jgi:hypothetical protein
MNMTKALALPAIAVMAATLLAGCGNTKASSSSKPATSPDAMMTSNAMAPQSAMATDPTKSPDAMMTEGAMMTESAMATAGTNG